MDKPFVSKQIFLLHFKHTPIFEQLKVEEALLHTSSDNWCIINEGSSPAIVMGISAKPKEWINLKKMETAPLPLIQRCSGGGTVIVDEETLFVSFIFQKTLFDFPCYPRHILRWSEKFYKVALSIPGFCLCENDYVIGMNKCGGNAQYIKKARFIHHSTFLWDYQEKHMDYLLYPPTTPIYRATRTHSDFLCRLKDHLTSKHDFISYIKQTLSTRYDLSEIDINKIAPILQMPHQQNTKNYIALN